MYLMHASLNKLVALDIFSDLSSSAGMETRCCCTLIPYAKGGHGPAFANFHMLGIHVECYTQLHRDQHLF